MAEPVGLGGSDQGQFSGDGRRIVIGEAISGVGAGGAASGLGAGPQSSTAMSDIAEELSTPSVIEPDRQPLSRAQSQSQSKSQSQSQSQTNAQFKPKEQGESNGKQTSDNSDDEDVETYAEVVKHGDGDYKGEDHQEDGDSDDDEEGRDGSNGDLSRKNSKDHLLD